jgi:choline kinase
MTSRKLKLKAIILAAGHGQRLGSLTQNTPKPLLHFRLGQSILEYTLLAMSKAEMFEKAVIVTGHMHAAVTRVIKSLSPNINFEIQDVVNPQYASKSVLYSVEAGLHTAGDGDILLMNGDTLFSMSVFDKIKRALLAMGVPKGAVIGSVKSVFDGDDVLVEFDNSLRIVHIGKNLRQARAISCGIIFISGGLRTDYVATLTELKPLDNVIHHDVIEGLCRNGVPISFIPVALHDWLEVDTIEDLHMASEKFGGDM